MLRLIPPGILVEDEDLCPAFEREFDASVGLARVRPAEDAEELGAGKPEHAVGEVVRSLREIDEAEQDEVVLAGRKAVVPRNR